MYHYFFSESHGSVFMHFQYAITAFASAMLIFYFTMVTS